MSANPLIADEYLKPYSIQLYTRNILGVYMPCYTNKDKLMFIYFKGKKKDFPRVFI